MGHLDHEIVKLNPLLSDSPHVLDTLQAMTIVNPEREAALNELTLNLQAATTVEQEQAAMRVYRDRISTIGTQVSADELRISEAELFGFSPRVGDALKQRYLPVNLQEA